MTHFTPSKKELRRRAASEPSAVGKESYSNILPTQRARRCSENNPSELTTWLNAGRVWIERNFNHLPQM
jgi:hypothetical protein